MIREFPLKVFEGCCFIDVEKRKNCMNSHKAHCNKKRYRTRRVSQTLLMSAGHSSDLVCSCCRAASSGRGLLPSLPLCLPVACRTFLMTFGNPPGFLILGDEGVGDGPISWRTMRQRSNWYSHVVVWVGQLMERLSETGGVVKCATLPTGDSARRLVD